MILTPTQKYYVMEVGGYGILVKSKTKFSSMPTVCHEIIMQHKRREFCKGY